MNNSYNNNDICYFTSIPFEILIKIFKYSDYKSFINLTTTCSYFYQFSMNDEFLKFIINLHYPFLTISDESALKESAKDYCLSFDKYNVNYKNNEKNENNYQFFNHEIDVNKYLNESSIPDNKFNIKINQFPSTLKSKNDLFYIPECFRKPDTELSDGELSIGVSLTSPPIFSELSISLLNQTISIPTYNNQRKLSVSSSLSSTSGMLYNRSSPGILFKEINFKKSKYKVFRPIPSNSIDGLNSWQIKEIVEFNDLNLKRVRHKTHYDVSINLPKDSSIDNVLINDYYIFILWYKYDYKSNSNCYNLLVLLRNNGQQLGQLNNILNEKSTFSTNLTTEIILYSTKSHLFITFKSKIFFLSFIEIFERIDKNIKISNVKRFVKWFDDDYDPNLNENIQDNESLLPIGKKLFNSIPKIQSDSSFNIFKWNKLCEIDLKPVKLIISKNYKYLLILTDSFGIDPSKVIYYLFDFHNDELHEISILRENDKGDGYWGYMERWFIDSNLNIYLYNLRFFESLWNLLDTKLIEDNQPDKLDVIGWKTMGYNELNYDMNIMRSEMLKDNLKLKQNIFCC